MMRRQMSTATKRVPLFINGEFVQSKTTQFIPVHGTLFGGKKRSNDYDWEACDVSVAPYDE